MRAAPGRGQFEFCFKLGQERTFAMLSGVAKFAGDQIPARTVKGNERAKVCGVKSHRAPAARGDIRPAW
jgi:hypothetical protein